jgi:hypothetical protein
MTTHSPLDASESTMVQPSDSDAPADSLKRAPENDPTFVKLAMRNMVRKGSKSLFHFALTTVGLLGLLVGLAFVTH